MQFESFLAVAAASTVIALMGVTLAVLWRRRRHAQWLVWWAGAYGAFGLGDFLTSLRTGASEQIEGAIGNAVVILGFGLVWTAIRTLEGRRPMLFLVALPAAAWIFLGMLAGFNDNLGVRVAALSTPAAIFSALGAWENWRGRREGLFAKPLMIAALLAISAVFASRVMLADVAPYPFGGQPQTAMCAMAFNLLLIGFGLVSTAALVAMTLERGRRRARQRALTDGVTNLPNREGLSAALPGDRLPAGAALILFDLDQFEQIVERGGAVSGDVLALHFARLCRQNGAADDVLARIESDSFALVLADTDRDAAVARAEGIRQALATMVVPTENGAAVCTTSVGVLLAPRDGPLWLSAAMAGAGAAARQARNQGRNRVVVSGKIATASHDFEERCVASDTRAEPV